MSLNREFFHLFVKNMNKCLVLIDKNGTIIYINDKFLEMNGYTQDEVIGHHATEFLDDDNQHICQEQRANEWQAQEFENLTVVLQQLAHDMPHPR